MQWWSTVTAFPRQVPHLTSCGNGSGNLTRMIQVKVLSGKWLLFFAAGKVKAQLGRLQFNIFWMLCYAVVNLHDRPRYKWLLFSAGGRKEESSHQAGRWVGGREGGPTWEASHPSQSSQCRLAWKVSLSLKLNELQVGITPSWQNSKCKLTTERTETGSSCS